MGDRREPLGRDPRRRDVRAAHDRRRRTRPHRQHGLDGWPHRKPGTRRVQHDEVRRGRPVRNARQGPEAVSDRRVGPVPDGGADAYPRVGAQPAGGAAQHRGRGRRRGGVDRPLPGARDSGRHGARRNPAQRAVRHHARRGPGAAAPPLRADAAVDGQSQEALVPPLIRWAREPGELKRAAAELGATPELALDTEGDSLHHYPERLALVQIGLPDGTVWLVDPLALADFTPLRPVFTDDARTLILHAGGNDLVHLKRRYVLTFASVFDTAIAARFLGGKALGLDVLLRTYLGVELPPSRQKDDWSARPLDAAQLAYAAADVQHLFALRVRLVDELQRVGRLAWVEEECAALAAQPAPERPVDPDAWIGVKGARELPPQGLAAMRELFALREQLARAADRPPFKVLGEDT